MKITSPLNLRNIYCKSFTSDFIKTPSFFINILINHDMCERLPVQYYMVEHFCLLHAIQIMSTYHA